MANCNRLGSHTRGRLGLVASHDMPGSWSRKAMDSGAPQGRAEPGGGVVAMDAEVHET